MSSIKLNLTPPIRRVAADASSSITINSNEQINNLSQISIPIKKLKKTSYNLVKQSRKKNSIQPPIVLRERSTSSSSSSSSSSKSTNNDSLRSFSGVPSFNQDDDDDASSNDDTNQQWNLDHFISNIPLRQFCKFNHIYFFKE
jgi:hypothetical protein